MEDYVTRVRRTVDSISDLLTADELAEVSELIGHDEAPEGLRALAWIIVERDLQVPPGVIDAIKHDGRNGALTGPSSGS